MGCFQGLLAIMLGNYAVSDTCINKLTALCNQLFVSIHPCLVLFLPTLVVLACCLYPVVTFTMSMTAYALCLLDWHDPKAGNAIYLLIFLTIVTFVMVIVTIRTVYRRWRTASTEEYVSEV